MTLSILTLGTRVRKSGAVLVLTFALPLLALAQVTPAAPVRLATGQALVGSVSAEQPAQHYRFGGDLSEPLLLVITSDSADAGSFVTLKDADSGMILALHSAQVSGARYRLPTGAAAYAVEITYGGMAPSEPYTICLTTERAAHFCEDEVTPPAELTPAPTALTTPVGSPLRPDLVLDGITAPAQAATGTPITIHVTVRNNGIRSAGPFQVGASVGGVSATAEVPGLQTGESTRAFLTLTPIGAGEQAITIVVDAASQVDETNEGNNTGTSAINVMP